VLIDQDEVVAVPVQFGKRDLRGVSLSFIGIGSGG
jgi:hypothetical protein